MQEEAEVAASIHFKKHFPVLDFKITFPFTSYFLVLAELFSFVDDNRGKLPGFGQIFKPGLTVCFIHQSPFVKLGP